MKPLKTLTIWVALGFLLMLPLFYIDWGGGGEHPDLERGVRVVRYLSSKNQIKRSSFLIVYPEGKPSDFVKWMFSTLGTAEWPPIEGGPEEELEEGAKAVGIPLLPKAVRLFAQSPNKDAGKQIVVRGDDARGMIAAEAYLAPGQPSVFTQEWNLTLP